MLFNNITGDVLFGLNLDNDNKTMQINLFKPRLILILDLYVKSICR